MSELLPHPKNDWPNLEFDPVPCGPLTNVRVLDLSRLVAGNISSMQLADFGATVMKVEPHENGDPLRAWKQEGVSTFWKNYCRNKFSIALDFRAGGAINALKRMIVASEILIENFRPGVMERMGLSPAELLSLKPSLVILRLSGFGQTGPYRSRPGFGTLVEALSGFAMRNGSESEPPLLPPLALADMITGLYGSNSVLMALRHAERTGQGQIIDLSLLESMTSILGPEAFDFELTGARKQRAGNGSNTSAPRNVYKTKDKKFVALSASIQSMVERLFRAIEREDLISDPRFVTNAERLIHRAELDEILSEWMEKRSQTEILKIFEDAEITLSAVYSFEDIHQDRHFIERGIYANLPDPDTKSAILQVPPPRMSETPGGFTRPAPALGQHTKEILSLLDFSDAEIEQLIEQEVVFMERGK